MQKNNLNIDELIIKVLTCNASKEEESFLFREIEKNKYAKNLFIERKKIFKVIELEKKKKEYDVNEALIQFKEKTKNNTQAYNKIIKSKFKNISTVFIFYTKVAVFILFIMLVVWYLFFKPETIEKITINPEYNIVLPDNSIIDLNRNTKISYKSNFKNNRVLKLTGEAYFKVTRDNEHEFIIITEDFIIKVVGTEFNIQSIPENDEITVSVITGIVNIKNNKFNNLNIILNTNKSVFINKKTGDFKHINNIYNNISWKTKKLIFKDTPLIEAVKVLENYYGEKFIINSKNIEKLKLTAKINNKSLDFVLEMLKISFDVKITKKDNYIIIEE